MKLPRDELARDLERLLGAGTVIADPPILHGYSIDGQDPSLVCVPSSAEEVAAVLRLCAEADAAVTPWGGGTAVHLGNRPRRFDVAVVLARLNRLIEHDDAKAARAQKFLAGPRDASPIGKAHDHKRCQISTASNRVGRIEKTFR